VSATVERRSAHALHWGIGPEHGLSLGAARAWLAATVHRAWFQTLVAGCLMWIAVTRATVATQNINLVPSVIVLGAFLGPVVFVIYVYERAREVSWPALLQCFIAGGVLGVTAASVLEYRTLLAHGALPTIGIGLIEESCKMIVPLAIFAFGHYRREADGLLFGVAAGMGFAAFESMGYGLSALLASGGAIHHVEQLLFVRGMLSPAGHGAWTGLICAALWRARAHPGMGSNLVVLAAFVTAVTLHALWDSVNSIVPVLPVAAVSLGLIAWRIHEAGRPAGARDEQLAVGAPAG
jgi:RsiW-degrading membrane proteinase PrsW (M82 family)